MFGLQQFLSFGTLNNEIDHLRRILYTCLAHRNEVDNCYPNQYAKLLKFSFKGLKIFSLWKFNSWCKWCGSENYFKFITFNPKHFIDSFVERILRLLCSPPSHIANNSPQILSWGGVGGGQEREGEKSLVVQLVDRKSVV